MNVAHFLSSSHVSMSVQMIIFPSTKIYSEVILQGEFMLSFEPSVTDYNFKAVLIAIGTHFIISLTTGILAGDVLMQSLSIIADDNFMLNFSLARRDSMLYLCLGNDKETFDTYDIFLYLQKE